MTPRQRVLASLNHKQPDRVAVDFGAHRSSGIMAIAYAKLKRALGISSGDIYVYDIIQQLAVVEPPVLDALGIDAVELGRGFCTEPADWKDWTLPDGTPCRIPGYLNIERRGPHWYLKSDDGVDLAIQKEGCLYFEQIHFPWMARGMEGADFSELADAFAHNMWCGIASPGGHIPFTAEGLQRLATGAKRLRASTDRAIVGLFGGNLFEVPQFLYRIDNYLLYTALYPEAAEKLSEVLFAAYSSALEKYLGAVGPYIDVIVFGDDLGCQNGPLISPESYRRFYKPWHTKLWARARQLANVKVMLHSCGGIEPLLADLIDAGLDATNPVQITCRGMDSRHLKDRYGERLTFWGGGCDTRDVLPNGTPQQVADHVRRQVDIFAPHGGFVFQQVHNVMSNVPPENVIAMFKAINE